MYYRQGLNPSSFVFPSNNLSGMLIETSLFQFHECIIKDSETLQCFK